MLSKHIREHEELGLDEFIRDTVREAMPLSLGGGTSTSSSSSSTAGSKSITIESPTNAEDLSLFFTTIALTATKIVFVITGTTSVTTTLRHGTDRNASGTEIVIAGTTANNSTTGNVVTSLDNPNILANSFIWVETTALSGTPGSLHITLFYS